MSSLVLHPLSHISANYHHIEKRKLEVNIRQMKKTIVAISVAIIAGLACPGVSSAEEENEQTVKMSDLPAAVQTTIKDKAGTNEIIKVEKKTEEGKTIYEAVMNKNGKEWSIEVNENGKFLKEYQEGQGEKRKER